MARKTKAEREAEEKAAQAAWEAMYAAEYPARLMRALERATREHSYELVVEGRTFVLKQPYSENRYEPTLLSLDFSRVSLNNLEWLEHELYEADEERAEALRVAEVRREALRKAQELFTEEERQLLNVPRY